MLKGEKKNPIPKEERETLYCKGCDQELSKDQFTVEGKTSSGRLKYRTRCKKCWNDHRKQNHSSYQQKQLLIEYVAEVKTECTVCEYSKLKSALEFHHLDPDEKDNSISQMVSNCVDIETIQEEIKKCVVLCNRCHREVHAGLIEVQSKSTLTLDK